MKNRDHEKDYFLIVLACIYDATLGCMHSENLIDERMYSTRSRTINTKQPYEELFTFVVVYDILITPGSSDKSGRTKAYWQIRDSFATE